MASEVRLAGDDTQTRLVVDLSQKIDIRAFTLANPYRVVMDMPQVDVPAPGQDRGGGARPDQGVPLRPGHAGRLAHGHRPGAPGPHRQGLRDRCRQRSARPPRARSRARPTARRSCARSRSRTGRRRPRRPEAPPEVKAAGDPRPLVVIDPGHGGIDNGTRAASGEMEKTIVLEFSLDAARQDRKDRQVPRRHDPHRRHLRGARRPRPVRAFAPGLAVHLDPRRRAAAQGGQCPRGDRLHALGAPVGCPRRAPGRGREPGRRHRRTRSLVRGEGRGRTS